MALTPAQLVTLKAHITASADLNIFPNTSDGSFEIAALLNLPAVPDFWIWKDSVSDATIMQNGFDWVRVDNLSVGKARIWEWMFGVTGAINPSKANVRAGIAEVWKGTAADNAVRGVVFGHCQRLATRAQKLFSTGAGTSTTIDGVGPATAGFAEDIIYNDVIQARAL